jgi:hypothetical protein
MLIATQYESVLLSMFDKPFDPGTLFLPRRRINLSMTVNAALGVEPIGLTSFRYASDRPGIFVVVHLGFDSRRALAVAGSPIGNSKTFRLSDGAIRCPMVVAAAFSGSKHVSSA